MGIDAITPALVKLNEEVNPSHLLVREGDVAVVFSPVPNREVCSPPNNNGLYDLWGLKKGKMSLLFWNRTIDEAVAFLEGAPMKLFSEKGEV